MYVYEFIYNSIIRCRMMESAFAALQRVCEKHGLVLFVTRWASGKVPYISLFPESWRMCTALNLEKAGEPDFCRGTPRPCYWSRCRAERAHLQMFQGARLRKARPGPLRHALGLWAGALHQNPKL